MAKILVIEKYLDDILDINYLCEKMNCCERTAYRRIKKYKESGPPGLIHGLSGKPSNNVQRKRDWLKKYAIQTKYRNFGPTLFAEKMEDITGTEIPIETMRRRMTERGCWLPKQRKNRVKRQTRKRKVGYGMMIQFDGSYHDWLENGEIHCLLIAVDDATGDIIEARFTKNERLIDIISFREGYFKKHGKPSLIYLDRHSSYKVNHKQDQFSEEMVTRFQRAMIYLGVEVIYARSPEGKGRVENKFGLIQDRGIKELRLAEIKTYDKAQSYLTNILIPQRNKKFSKKARASGDYHIPLTMKDKKYFEWYFAQRTPRKINRAGVVQYMSKKYQIPKGQRLAGTNRVTILETHLGNIQIWSGKICLPFTTICS